MRGQRGQGRNFQSRLAHSQPGLEQTPLLVEVKRVYRLFDLTYVVIGVENRDPSKTWVLDRPEIAVTGQSQATDVKVMLHTTEFPALPPGEAEKIVIVFNTARQDAQYRYNV